VALRDGYRFRVFDNRILRTIRIVFGPKKNEIIGS
jgi:hypothetical protein